MFKYLNFYIFIFLVSFPFVSEASILSFNPPTREKLGIGQEFQIDLMIDTQGKTINAVEGRLVYNTEALKLISINESSSIVTLWLPRAPHEEPVGTVAFSGITPNGFSGVWKPLQSSPSPGRILTLVFKPQKQTANGEIKVENARVILNDGKATPDELSILNFSFDVLNYTNSTTIQQDDTDPPEEFTPVIARDRSLFNNQYFLVFQTHDTGSGIERYEVKEGNGDFIIAESPYLLKNQNLNDMITVKAVDRARNERVKTIVPDINKINNGRQPFIPIWFYIAILCLMVILFIVWRATSKHFF